MFSANPGLGLAAAQWPGQTWPEGKPIWGAEAERRSLEVDRVQVSEDDPPPRAAIGQPVEASEMVADAGAYVFRYDFTA